MKKNTIPILLALGGLGYLFISQKVDIVTRLDFRFGGQSNFSLKNGALTFNQSIIVLNPTSNNLTINNIDLDVSFNRSKIGNTYFINKAVLQAGQDTTLNCRCVIPFTNIGLIWNSIKEKGFVVNLKGTIKAIGFVVPVNEDIKITIPKF